MELVACRDHPTQLFENGGRRQFTVDDRREFFFSSPVRFEFRQLQFEQLLLIGIVDGDFEGDAFRSAEISKSLSIPHHDTREVLRRTTFLNQNGGLKNVVLGNLGSSKRPHAALPTRIVSRSSPFDMERSRFWGIQFHSESLISTHKRPLVKHFLQL